MHPQSAVGDNTPEMDSDVTVTTVPTLLRLSVGGVERQFQFLPGEKIQLGRSLASDLVAALPSVSREHATISAVGDGRLSIRDNGSACGTFVNGDLLPPNHEYLLRDGDVIRLGPDFEITAGYTHSAPEPVTVRLSGGGPVLPLRLTPGSEMMLGRIPDSPLFTVFGPFEMMSRNHASIAAPGNLHFSVGLSEFSR